MTPEQATERAALRTRIADTIEALDAGRANEHARDLLLIELARYQARHVAPYGRFCAQRRASFATLLDVPALPTDAFRFARISSRAPDTDVRTFESSGTTSDARSRHAFADLGLYDLAAERAARRALFPDRPRMKLLLLVPSEAELPTSSLSYMLARFVTWFGSEAEYLWPVDGARIELALSRAERAGEAVALLGTSFAFVHALDALGDARFHLPAGSRIMQTGGFKGRSREVAPEAMRAWLSTALGVPEPFVIAEYGMTELSSQLYETTLREAALGRTPGPRALWAPPWVRAVPVDPERLTPVAPGETGLVRIDDLANLDSVSAIQTADVGRYDEGGLTLLGRAQGAVARGCSITADELLGGGR